MNPSTSGRGGGLYFHAPCFDGAVSAALAAEILERMWGWRSFDLRPVNYDARDTWLQQDLGGQAAVVDFLYHPSALFWVDHHQTAFVSPSVTHRNSAPANAFTLYDPTAPSCARVLLRVAEREFPGFPAFYTTWVSWADRIDAARYESVNEVMEARSPALRIYSSLALDRDRSLSLHLVRAILQHLSPAEVASDPLIDDSANRFMKLSREGTRRFGDNAELESGAIVVFEVDSEGAFVNRYTPFYVFPEARYSAGIITCAGRIKLTTMRNPWADFLSAPLGKLCEAFGGGGHRRVGSVLFGRGEIDVARTALHTLVRQIREYEASRNITVQ